MLVRGSRFSLIGFAALALLYSLPSGTAFARQSDPVPALPAPNDPAFHQWVNATPVQWPLYSLRAPEAWQVYPAGYLSAIDRPLDAPLVALIDTGVDVDHPDFLNSGATGADVSQGGQFEVSLARTYLWGSPADETSDVTDEHGHGTHLAGIIAAAANNGETAGSGVVGLGYPLRLLPLKVAGADGSALHADIAQAIIYAADQDAAIVVIGLSGPTWSQTLQESVDYAWERGCFIVAPSGDAMGEIASFPAACPHVFGVGAVAADGLLASYSTAGDNVALAAPGGDELLGVYSVLPAHACTLRQDGASLPYAWLYGSAQAAAHVAAAAGLYAGFAGIRPSTGDEGTAIWQALEQTAGQLPGDSSGAWQRADGWGALTLDSVLGATGPAEGDPGGIVGRVLSAGMPAVGANVVAARAGSSEPYHAISTWPAGAYRIANLPAGDYEVTATAGEATGIWERVRVRSHCDAPAVDFRLGDPPAGAAIVSAQLPTAAVRGGMMQVSITLRNTGQSTWRRRDGYCLRQGDEESPFFTALPQVVLPPGEEVAPGEEYTFTFSVPVPDVCAFCHVSWQMSQEGGQGRFGEAREATISVTSFLDVPADFWAAREIEAARAADLVRGYADFTYHPVQAVTRDQMAVYLARAVAGGDEAVPPGPATPHFTDVPADFWAYDCIEYVASVGIASGYDDDLYHPEMAVDRGQMAAFIARAMAGGEAGLASYAPPSTPSFPDVRADAWNYKHVEYIKARGVTGGYPDDLYHSEWPCTRDQMAVYLVRAFDVPTR